MKRGNYVYNTRQYDRKIGEKNIFKFKNKIYNLNNCDISSNGENYFQNQFFINQNKDELIVFDIGANKGEYSKSVLEKSKVFNKKVQMHVFEPQKILFDELKINYTEEINNNIFMLNNFAVSNKDNAELKLFKDKEGGPLASLCKRELLSCNINMEQIETVKTIRLDSYIERNNIANIDLLKIDVEGHEYNVIEGLGNYLDSSFIDFIQFEYGGNNLDSMVPLIKIWKKLDERGFAIAKVMPKGLKIEKYNIELENFQYCNYVAISKDYINKMRIN